MTSSNWLNWKFIGKIVSCQRRANWLELKKQWKAWAIWGSLFHHLTLPIDHYTCSPTPYQNPVLTVVWLLFAWFNICFGGSTHDFVTMFDQVFCFVCFHFRDSKLPEKSIHYWQNMKIKLTQITSNLIIADWKWVKKIKEALVMGTIFSKMYQLRYFSCHIVS